MSPETKKPWRKFEEIMTETYAKVNQSGELTDLEAWKKAYPEVEFEEIDEFFTGMSILWEERTQAELAFYVNYMQNQSGVDVSYKLDVDGNEVLHEIDDPEMIWYLWFHGCFKTVPNMEIDDEAKEVLFGYTISGPYSEVLRDMIDIDDIEVLSLVVKMRG